MSNQNSSTTPRPVAVEFHKALAMVSKCFTALELELDNAQNATSANLNALAQLISTIHRDGGQTIQKMGWDNAYKSAIEKVNTLHHELAELSGESH